MIESVSIGIDPGGTSGGISAIITPLKGPRAIYNIDFKKHSEREVSDFLKRFSAINLKKAVLEKVNAMPGQGVVSVFSFGENYGFIQGLLVAHNIPFVQVTPATWQKKFKTTSIGTERFSAKEHVGASEKEIAEIKKAIKARNQQRKKAHKDELYEIAQNMYPNFRFTKAMADAVLIAEYCRKFEL